MRGLARHSFGSFPNCAGLESGSGFTDTENRKWLTNLPFQRYLLGSTLTSTDRYHTTQDPYMPQHQL